MQIETLRDVLHWTQKFHLHLQDCMQHCADRNEVERAKMLLVYLSDHENKLVIALDGFEKVASTKALNTWCYEYINKHPILRHEKCTAPFAELSTREIMMEINNLHGQVTELYGNLLERAVVPSVREFLENLKDMEEHESMLMVKNSNQLEDM